MVYYYILETGKPQPPQHLTSPGHNQCCKIIKPLKLGSIVERAPSEHTLYRTASDREAYV